MTTINFTLRDLERVMVGVDSPDLRTAHTILAAAERAVRDPAEFAELADGLWAADPSLHSTFCGDSKLFRSYLRGTLRAGAQGRRRFIGGAR